MNEEKARDEHKVTLFLTSESLTKVDDFRYAKRIPSRAAAMRKIFADGLAVNEVAPTTA